MWNVTVYAWRDQHPVALFSVTDGSSWPTWKSGSTVRMNIESKCGSGMTDAQKAFLDKASAAATKAAHPFPRMAAAEAALESGYGLSGLAIEDNNLFGMKQHIHPEYKRPPCLPMSSNSGSGVRSLRNG